MHIYVAINDLKYGVKSIGLRQPFHGDIIQILPKIGNGVRKQYGIGIRFCFVGRLHTPAHTSLDLFSSLANAILQSTSYRSTRIVNDLPLLCHGMYVEL